MTNPIVLVHISDIHFVNDQTLLRGLRENGRFFTKQHLGWLNYNLRRRHHFEATLKYRLLSRLNEIDWDYLVISGDLTTLSLDREFRKARDAIAPLIQKGNVLLTAGNHDRYTRESAGTDPIRTFFSDCWPYNRNPTHQSEANIYELDDNTILLELDMATPRNFFSSRGKTLNNLESIENTLKKYHKNKVKVAIGHYPAFLPPDEHEGYFHEIPKKKELQQFLLRCEIDFYLHGHIHKSWMFKPDEEADLLCINSGGCCRYLEGEWAGFHRIEINSEKTTVERILI
ncbi:metallophosphoesterase [bacterium]|nr:metallophosphoesterase [bacterium]